MRLAIHEYASGGRAAFETTDDGSQLIGTGDWAGKRKVGERICAYAEVACDSNEEGLKRLIDALDFLTTELNKRLGEEQLRGRQLMRANSGGS